MENFQLLKEKFSRFKPEKVTELLKFAMMLVDKMDKPIKIVS